jgi:chemotaxis protein methyltransferase CheR
VYTNLEVNRGLTEYYLNKYFTKDGTSWQISDELKTNMYFRPHNLKEKNKTTDKYDFVLLRNVLIYFDRDTKVQVLENIKHSMQPGGYLLLGAAEHVPEEITGFRQCSEVRGLYHLGGS